MPPRYPCNCTKCMSGGRTVPKLVARSTYNSHASMRPQVSSFSAFVLSETGLPVESFRGTLAQDMATPDAAETKPAPTVPDVLPPHNSRLGDALNVPPAPVAPEALPPCDELQRDMDWMELDDDSDAPEGLVGMDVDVDRDRDDVVIKVEGEYNAIPLFFDNGGEADNGDDNIDNNDPLHYVPQAGGHIQIPEPEDAPEHVSATLEELKLVQDFIEHIRAATLDADNLPAEVIESMRNPAQLPVSLDDDESMRTGIDLFITMEHETEAAFNKARDVFNRTLSRRGDPNGIPTLFKVKEEIKQITGIYPMMHDMCPNSCMAYTGPLSSRDTCIKCGLPRYNPEEYAASSGTTKVPQRQFLTLPLGPQLQSKWRTKDGAKDMRYRRDLTRKLFDDAEARPDKQVYVDVYEDIFHGSAYLDQVYAGNIGDDDMVLMLSIDGAQLYESKQSDCWIYIWVVLDLSPDKRYKKRHIFPGGFFPGPNKPGIIESFLFPGLHHLSALAKEGLHVWDAFEERLFLSYIFLILGLADGPGLTYLNGLTGHSGAFGCRLFCPVQGRRKEGGTHYYPALRKPHNYNVDGCAHDSIPANSVLGAGSPEEYNAALNIVLASRTQGEHQRNRKLSGISRPSILSSLPSNRSLPTPQNNGTDLMHLAALNVTDLFISHWRGTMECDPNDSKASWDWVVLTGNVWKSHGQEVANARPYLPGSFDRPPRNIAEKISSGYKAWEFLTYFYTLGPGLLYGILPEKYWKHYCKLVAAMRILHQRKITRKQLLKAYQLLLDFVGEYEDLYYQGKSSRLHFCRQSVHALLHLAMEVARLGPPVIYTQWPMERTIGDLGQEIFQHSTYQANLAQRGIRRAQVNAMILLIAADIPEAKRQRSQDLQNGYILSMAEDRPQSISHSEVAALRKFLQKANPVMISNLPESTKIRRWARLQLPNLQYVRTAWKEVPKGLHKCRMSRNIMYKEAQLPEARLFGEVQYFFQVKLQEEHHTVALVSRYGEPNPQHLVDSSGAFIVCQYRGVASLEVIDIRNIISCVAMVPFRQAPGFFYVGEKMGLDMAFLAGIQENDDDINI